MKVYFGACGLGLGHVTRSEKLARLLLERGNSVHFSSYSDGVEYLRRTELSYFETLPISFRTREDGTIDPKLTATHNGVTVGLWKFIKQFVAEVEQIAKFQPDIVVSDTRITTLMAGVLLRRPTCLLINQYSVQMPNNPTPGGPVDRGMFVFSRIVWRYATAVLDLIWGLSKLIIIPDLPPPYTISAYNLSLPEHVSGKVKLVGPLKGHYTKREVRKSHSGARAGLRVFVCVSGPANDRQYLLGALSTALKEAPKSWNVVVSGGNPRGTTVPTRNGRVTVFDWMDEETYNREFRESDVVVSRAGHETIMMAITTGRPLVLIPPPNHTEQANNARRCAEIGLGVVVSQDALSGDSLRTAVVNSVETCTLRAHELSELLTDQRMERELIETLSSLADPHDSRVTGGH